MRSGAVVPIVPGGRGRGKPALFDYPTLNEFLGKPKQGAGRPKRGLDANEPAQVEAAIGAMAAEITTLWPHRSRSYLIGQAIDEGVIATSDLRRLPANHYDYIHAIVTMLVLAAQNPKHSNAWPTLLILMRRLEVAGASIQTAAGYLEVDPTTVRLYRARWRNLREPAEYRPRSGEIVVGRRVPLSSSEVEAITQKTGSSWGWRAIRKMKEKDPEAVDRTGRRHRTLTGIEWREIAAHETAAFEAGGKYEPGRPQQTRSKRSRAARGEQFADRNNEGGPNVVPSWWRRQVNPSQFASIRDTKEARELDAASVGKSTD